MEARRNVLEFSPFLWDGRRRFWDNGTTTTTVVAAQVTCSIENLSAEKIRTFVAKEEMEMSVSPYGFKKDNPDNVARKLNLVQLAAKGLSLGISHFDK